MRQEKVMYDDNRDARQGNDNSGPPDVDPRDGERASTKFSRSLINDREHFIAEMRFDDDGCPNHVELG